jgi:hypothetical protein
LDLIAALHYNLAVMAAIPMVLFFELRALYLLWRNKPKPLLPRCLYSCAVVYLIAWMLLRNTAMLLGHDPTGDHAVYWATRITPLRVWLLLLLGVLLALAVWVAILPPRILQRLRFVAICLSSVLPLTILAVLYNEFWILWPNVIVIIGIFVYNFGIAKKRRSE